MSPSASKDFGLKFQNIPIVNLRLDFMEIAKYARDIFREKAESPSAHMAHWHNNRHEIDGDINWLVCRLIMGSEAYVRYAVWEALHRRGLWSPEKGAALSNPFGGPTRKIYEAYFHVLLSLVANDLSLKKASPILWQKTVEFYSQVRNPLFHGMQAYDVEPEQFMAVVNHFESLYAWMDSWCLPEWVFGHASGHIRTENSG